MAIPILKLEKNWYNKTTVIPGNWDNIRSPLESWALINNKNLAQIGRDTHGDTYAYNNNGAATAYQGTLTTVFTRTPITNVFYGDAGTEPALGVYTLAIGGVNYYVQTLDFAKDKLICFKVEIPKTYRATPRDQIKLRLGLSSAGTDVAYTFNCYFGLLDEGDVIDINIPVHTDLAQTITSGAADEKVYDETLEITDADGKMGGVLVAAGDVITGKIVRTNVDANDFRLISLETSW